MTEIDRRHLIGALAAGSALLAGAVPAMGANRELKLTDLKKDTDIACLYHCDFGDDRRYDAMLRNINNHLSAHDFDPMGIKIVIVAHGPGIKYHLSDLCRHALGESAGHRSRLREAHGRPSDKRIPSIADKRPSRHRMGRS